MSSPTQAPSPLPSGSFPLVDVVRQMSEAVILADPALRITDYTGNAERVYGWTRDEAIGKSLATDFETQFPHGDGDVVRARLATGQETRSEVRARRKDGTWVDLELLAVPLRDERAVHVGWLSVARDITTEAAAARALRESEALLRSTFVSMAEGVVIQDVAGRILSCNPAAERIFGVSGAQMEGRTSADPRWRAIHEDGTPFPGETHPGMVTLRTGTALAGVVMGVEKPGEELTWISINSEPLRPVPGAPVHGVVATFTDITARKHADSLLRRQEAESRAFFESPAMGIALVGMDDRWLRVNPALCAMLGYSAEELSRLTWLDLTHPDDRTLHAEFEADVLDGRRASMSVDKRYVRKDGTTLWSLTSVSCVRDDHGTVTAKVAILKDIGDRKAAEVQLKEAEERLSRVLEGSNDGAVEWHIPSGRIGLSARFAEILGWSPGELEPNIETRARLMHPDDEAREWPALHALFRGEIPQLEYETRARHKDGHWVWALVRAKVVERDAEGHPVRVAGTFTDISDRKRAEIALAAREAELNAVFNATDESIFLLDSDDTLLALNDVAAQRMGRPREALVGRPLAELLPADVAERRRPFLQRARATGEQVVLEDERYGRWMISYIQPVAWSAGRECRLAIYSRDITERKRMEDGLRTALAENERLVAELREALASVKTLSGFLPICAFCKKIRNDQGYWDQLEAYISTHTDARFSHGICDACAVEHFPEVAGRLHEDSDAGKE